MKKKPQKIVTKKNINKLFLVIFSAIMMLSAAWIGQESDFVLEAPAQGENALFFSNQKGDNLEDIYVSAILKSQKSILLLIYSITNDKVINAIRQKGDEGIPIKVICDAKASPNVISKLGPKIDVLRRFGPGLMHLKMLVIDDHECWIGSANFTGESFKMHGNLILGMSNPSLAKTIQNKANSLTEYDREEDIPCTTFQIGTQKIDLSFLPDDNQGSVRIKQLIRSAKKTIRVAMFTFTRYDLAKELILARNRGIDVEVALDKNSSKGASAKIAALLESENIKISYNTNSALLHHKFMLIDDSILEVGSANWTKAAFTSNDDCFLVLYNLTTEQQEFMNNLWSIIQSECSIGR